MARLLPAGLTIDDVAHPAKWPTLVALSDLMIIGLRGMAGLDALGEQFGTHRLRRFSGRHSDDCE